MIELDLENEKLGVLYFINSKKGPAQAWVYDFGGFFEIIKITYIPNFFYHPTSSIRADRYRAETTCVPKHQLYI